MQGEGGRGIERLGDLSNFKHVVFVGPFCSGTNAMGEYLEKYFDVVVHPPRLPTNATGWIGDMSEPKYQPWRNHWQVGWKHMPPLNSESSKGVLPSGSLLIQMIREPLGWIKSLVKSPYSPESNEGMQKQMERWNWMTQGVRLDSPENEYRDCVFSDAIDLWACYAHGYLSGRFIAGETIQYTTIVRHEDLVAHPTKIINALFSKRLKRKRVGEGYPRVAPIGSYIGGHRGSNSPRGKALTTINRGRFTDPSELRHWVAQQTQGRSTLIGVLGHIPYMHTRSRTTDPWSGSSPILTHWRTALSHLPLLLPVGATRKRDWFC